MKKSKYKVYMNNGNCHHVTCDTMIINSTFIDYKDECETKLMVFKDQISAIELKETFTANRYYNIVQSAIAYNKEKIAQVSSYYDKKSLLTDFTIRIDLGRQTGKTAFAAELAKEPGNLMIVHSYRMADRVKKEYKIKNVIYSIDKREHIENANILILDEFNYSNITEQAILEFAEYHNFRQIVRLGK